MSSRSTSAALPLLLPLLAACGSSSSQSPPACSGDASCGDASAPSGSDGSLGDSGATPSDASYGPDAPSGGGDASSPGPDSGSTDASTDATSADASLPVPTCPSGERPFLLRNQCAQPVQVAFTSGATPSTCPGGSACAIGTCNTSNDICYWPLPDLGPTQGALGPGDSITVCFPAPIAGQGTQWSGNLSARVGCTSPGSCPAQPTTLSEFTLANETTSPPGTDFYDVSIINGMSVAMAMTPAPGTYAAQSGDPYSCATPGASAAQGPLGACSWNVQPTVGGIDETTWARAVAPGGAACTSDATCAAGQSCGLSQNGASFSMTCGAPLGWWTADQICGVDPSFGAPYDCAATVTNHDGSTSTYTQLFECSGPDQSQSCYSTGASVDCCGCGTDAPGWPGVLAPGYGCKNDNPNWEAHAAPWLEFLKKACPTAYTYPFDDATSTFTCTSAQGGSASSGVAYDVTFCP